MLWTDADSIVGNNWIHAHRKTFEDEETVAQSGIITFDDTIHWSFLTYQAVAARVKRIIGYQKVPQLCMGGANISFRKHYADLVGGFEPGSDAGEDQILFGKMANLGKVVVNPDPEAQILTSGRRWSSGARTLAHVGRILGKFNRIGVGK